MTNEMIILISAISSGIFSYILAWYIGKHTENILYHKLKMIIFIGLSIFTNQFAFHPIIKNMVIAYPTVQETVEIVQEWYPNSNNIKVMSLTTDLTQSDTYFAYVSFERNYAKCETIVTVRRAVTNNYLYYSNKGYTCN